MKIKMKSKKDLLRKSSTRTENIKRNIATVIITNFGSIILTFAVRTAVLRIMGEQYVGLSSLFTSIFSVLNLAELGFSGAVIYNMYKPLAEHNAEQVGRLLNFYRKIYKLIGSLILVVGFIIMPFVPRLISGSWPADINIYVLYAICLIETTLSYLLFGYKSSLIEAAQRMDIAKIINFLVHFVIYAVQILTLLFTHNYYIYAIISLSGTVLINLAVAAITDWMYPEYKAQGVLSNESKREIGKRVRGLLLERMTSVTRDSFDSIIISAQLGLTVVGIYNNYYFINSGVFSAINLICQSMQASIGNSIVTESVEKNYRDYRSIHFIFVWILTWTAAFLLCLYQPFMKLWAGEDLTLPTSDMVLCVAFFFVRAVNSITMLYFRGNGLWWRLKPFYIAETISNIVLNIILGRLYGVSGIIIASIVTQFFIRIIPTIIVLFREYFKVQIRKFALDAMSYIFICIIACVASYMLCDILNDWLRKNVFLVNVAVCIVVPNFVLLMFNFRRELFKDSLEMIRIHMKVGSKG